MGKVKLEIEFKPSDALRDVTINGRSVDFSGEKGSIDLEELKTYRLIWTIKGEEGTKYSLKILSPPNINLEVTRVLDESKKDTGYFLIEL